MYDNYHYPTLKEKEIMRSWQDDDDEGPDYREDEKPKRRALFRTPETRKLKTWNGNPVANMESDHIMNAMMFCEKKFVEGESNHRVCYKGEEEFYFAGPSDMFPEYANLREEWFKRLKG